jgi:hypothetical protein
VGAGCRAGNANHGLDPVDLPIYRNYPNCAKADLDFDQSTRAWAIVSVILREAAG